MAAICFMLLSEGQPPQMAGLDPSSSNIIKGHRMNDMIGKGKAIADVEPIPQKKPNLVGCILTISWAANEIQRMNILEILQLAVVGKLSYGAPDIYELRSLIPNQYGITEGCQLDIFVIDTF
ncbi:hypothetical protein RDI58_001124 [Solanum bulbocastanum]|uniref:Uncharacterized protein n=1 Tax=Solanum bulbocastanum TaxID=147425 RepID=A0AAN8YPP2_SOLBU